MIVFVCGDVLQVGGKKAYGIIAPVVQELFAVHLSGRVGLIEFKDGHQLDRIDAEFFQIGNFFLQSGKSPLMLHAR